MHLVYIDDSKDDKLACYSALAVPEDSWNDCLEHLVQMRRQMRQSDGIYVRKELHSTDWLAGRGHIAPHAIPVGARVRLWQFLLSGITMMPNVRLFNAAVPQHQEERAFEWLLNRININMSKSGSRALLIADEGKNYDAMLRRMRHFNHVPSQFGAWDSGSYTKNIKINRILEDISYRDSERSMFVQMADACAFALLRRENPTTAAVKYGFDKAWYILEPIMVKRASKNDPYGVIR